MAGDTGRRSAFSGKWWKTSLNGCWVKEARGLGGGDCGLLSRRDAFLFWRGVSAGAPSSARKTSCSNSCVPSQTLCARRVLPCVNVAPFPPESGPGYRDATCKTYWPLVNIIMPMPQRPINPFSLPHPGHMGPPPPIIRKGALDIFSSVKKYKHDSRSHLHSPHSRPVHDSKKRNHPESTTTASPSPPF